MLCDYALFISLVGICLIGAIVSMVGVFAVVKKQSLLGDTLCHAALPGIVGTLIVTHTRSISVLVVGGSLSALCGALSVYILLATTRLKKDTVLGIVLSSFFGAGLVLITFLQKKQLAHQAIVTPLFLGSSFMLAPSDIGVLVLFCSIIFLNILACWKEYKLVCFDHNFAFSIGYPVTVLSLTLLANFVITITISLHLMGIILTSSLLITPGVIARQWCMRLESIVRMASCIGAVASSIGFLISAQSNTLPTGPTIVLVLSTFIIISFVYDYYS